jgi:hypothetical protein
MRRVNTALLVLVALLLAGRFWQELTVSALPPAEFPDAATDQTFCADANGDGTVDQTDAIEILRFFFLGTTEPYCFAQGVSLDSFATLDNLQELATRVSSLEAQRSDSSLIATGTYIGDGTNNRLIQTGLTGQVRFVRLWLETTCGGLDLCIAGYGERSDTMPEDPPSTKEGITFVESDFVVDSRLEHFPGFSPGRNSAGLTYHWVTFASSVDL